MFSTTPIWVSLTFMGSDFLHAPIDPVSGERLADSGLRVGLVDTEDRAAFAAWLHANMRGFHDGRASDELLTAHLDGLADRRATGVWDEGSDDVASPVATVASWPAQLTVPGERTVTAWAISSVTVAPTHRRKGIARALLEAELRTAASLMVPLAMLTVSESAIYGRFGFAPAAMAADFRIDTRRARWTGPATSGRLQFVTLEQVRAQLPALFDRARLASPGQLEVWGLRWDQITGLVSDDKDRTKNLRAVRYDDEGGELQGFALYRVTGGDDDFSAHSLEVEYLLSATDDAYAALWRYLLEVDLVSEVKAHLRSVDEPLRWHISDQRAVKVWTWDHLWLRILDVTASLEARSYVAPGRIVIELADDMGFAAGRYLVSVDGGAATVTTLDGAAPDDAAELSMTVNELSALYLGGVSAATLVAAGRITELRPGSAVALDTVFRSPRAPWLSVWF